MVSSTKLVTDFNENVWGPLLDKTDEMDPTINIEQPTLFRELKSELFMTFYQNIFSPKFHTFL